jgi:hypothetical protein
MNRLRYTFRSRIRTRLADAEAMIGYLEASLDDLERRLVKALDAAGIDFGGEDQVCPVDEEVRVLRRLDTEGGAQ